MNLVEGFLENYVHSVERAVAGYMTGKKNSELSFKEVHAAKEKLNNLPDSVYTKIMLELEDGVTTTLEQHIEGSFITEGDDDKPKKPRKSWDGSVMRSATGAHEKDSKKRDVMKGKFRSEKHKTQVDESVLGMTEVENLNRLKSLAGMKKTNSDNTTVQEASRRLRHLHELDLDPDYDETEFEDEMDTGIDGDQNSEYDDFETEFDQDFDQDFENEMSEPEAALPDAATQIRTAIETIRTNYPNLKLSEVGLFKKEMDALVDEMRKEGLRYLEESKKYKLKK